MMKLLLLVATMWTLLYAVQPPSRGKPVDKAKEFEKIERRYNLTHAKKGKQAVSEAIEFVMNQMNRAETKLSTNTTSKYHDKCKAGSQCPICEITYETIINEGRFEYLGDHHNTPYDHTCFSLRVRYHTAPMCEKEERERGIKPIYNWKWTTQSAIDGYCVMPDASPGSAVQSFLKGGNRVFAKSKPITVLMLGLSFMGQPFQALGCKFPNLVTGGAALDLAPVGGATGGHFDLPFATIRENGGQCTGYERKDIGKFYPKQLHPNITTYPKQNVEECNLDSSLMIFASTDVSVPDVQVCYTYIFNIKKNFPPGSKLPCSLQWSDVDIVFSIPVEKEIFNMYIPNTGGKVDMLPNLRVVFVDQIYAGLIESQLKTAYMSRGFPLFTSADYRAKYNKCGPDVADVHYRLPGFPDYAIDIWFSLIATGLNEQKEHRKHSSIRYWS